MTPTVWDKLYRRQFLESSQIRFPAICHEDEVFTPLLMAHKLVVAVLPSLLYHYVRRGAASLASGSIRTAQRPRGPSRWCSTRADTFRSSGMKMSSMPFAS